MKNKKQYLLTIAVIVLFVIIMIASIFYLVTGKMVPGLIPLCTALLMVPMVLIWNGKEKGVLYAVLFMIAALLNLIAAVMQILQAL